MDKYLQVNCKIVQKILIVRSIFKKILYCFFLYYILIRLYLVYLYFAWTLSWDKVKKNRFGTNIDNNFRLDNHIANLRKKHAQI